MNTLLRLFSRITLFTLLMVGLVLPAQAAAAAPAKIKVMLLTGQSSKYHAWNISSPILKRQMEQAGIFAVDVVTTPPTGADMSGFTANFAAYDVVVLVYEGAEWPAATKAAFVTYMKNGGGLVSFHDTDNAFPYWPEFNEMIGVGGWGLKADGNIGARDQSWGPKVRWRDGAVFHDHTTPGNATHPPKHDFLVVTRTPDHPIMKGLPASWLHINDELYSQLRGPAKNLTVLATASADPVKHPRGGTGENEPILMTITYEKGRIFHTTLGHVNSKDVEPIDRLQCVGFTTTFLRGVEWAATGKVTLPVPADFPTAEKTSVRP